MNTCHRIDPVLSLRAPRLRSVPYTASFMQNLTEDDTGPLWAALRAGADWDEGEDDEHLARAAAERRWRALWWQWYDPEILMAARRRVSAAMARTVSEAGRRMRLDERRHVTVVRAELAQVLDALDAVAFRHGVESAVVRTFGRQFYRRRSVGAVVRGLRATLESRC